MHDGLVKLLKLLRRITRKMNILAGNNKTVVWSAACPTSGLFGKGEPILGSAYTSPNIGSPLPNNQMSDSSRPNNCIIPTPFTKTSQQWLIEIRVACYDLTIVAVKFEVIVSHRAKTFKCKAK